MAEDPRFRGHMERVANAEELRQIVQQWLDSMPDDEQIYRTLEAHRVPYAPVLSVEQAMREPHLRELLGLAPERIAQLEQAGVLGRGPR